MTQCPKSREIYHRHDLNPRRALDRWKQTDPGFRFVVVDRGSVAEWAYLERGWISYYRSRGRLYNVLDGGPTEQKDYQRRLKKEKNLAKANRKRQKKQAKRVRGLVQEKLARPCPLSNWHREPRTETK